MLRTPVVAVGWLCCLSVAASIGLGQSNLSAAELFGFVRDPRSLPVPAAEVRLTSLSNGRAFRANADGSGEYRFLLVPASEYELQVASAGFRPVRISAVELAVGQSLQLD